MGDIKNPYNDYIKSGRWKCTDSPTGAHFWVERDGKFLCKYCGEERPVPHDNAFTAPIPMVGKVKGMWLKGTVI